MLTFLVGLKGGLWVWVTGEADDIQSGKFGKEIVSPRHSYLWRNEVNLGGREEGREGREGGREGGREEGREGGREGGEGGREGGREGGKRKGGREGGREGGKGRERRGGESWSEELSCSRTAGGGNTTLFSTRTSCFLSSSTT